MYDTILSLITAFSLTYLAIPSIIQIAKVKRLYDEPGERRSHTTPTPSLGGIAIFAGVIFSIILWTPFDVFGDLQYILCSFIIIFLIGAKDDISPISPTKKLIGEFLAAGILVFKSNVILTSLYGVFGIGDLNYITSVVLSIFTIIVIINAFNLIDGINGLSGSIGTLIALTLGTWFLLIDRVELAIVAFSLAGAVMAFLKYNYSPAKIFMGDVPAVAVGILILPLFDTLRVFVTRIARGNHPLHPDRTHIHHLLLDFGLTHMQATAVLVTVNIFFIGVVIYFQNLGSMKLLMIILMLATLMTTVLFYLVAHRKQNKGLNA